MALLDRLRGGLSRTREVLTMPLEDLVRGRRPLDAAALESVEEALLAADMGLPAVQEALEVLEARSGEIAAGGLPAMRTALREEIQRSAKLQVEIVARRLAESGVGLELTPAALEYLANTGYDPIYGARPLKRVIQRSLGNPLARKILAGNFPSGETVVVDVEDGKLTFAATGSVGVVPEPLPPVVS